MKLGRFAAWLMLLIAFAGIAHAQSAPTYSREQRLSRFYQFLVDRKQALAAMGATLQTWSTPAGDYPNARLLHPNDVVSHLSYAINRYDSYLARVQAQAVSEGLVIRSVTFGGMVKPPLYASPELDYPRLNGETDDSGSLRRAMSTGSVWLTPGRTYELRSALQIPANAQVVSDGSATILIRTGADTAFRLGSDPTDPTAFIDAPIRISGVSNVTLRDFRVRMAAESGDEQPLLKGGIQVVNSTGVRIEGLELLGFPRTRGILGVNSGRDVTFQDNLIHGSYTRMRARQVTGIEADQDAQQGFSTNLQIIGNLVLGMLLDNGVVFSSDSRYVERKPGEWLGYESDGVNIAENNPNALLVANNSIMDVGEGIDIFGAAGTYRNNHIERAFSHGIKLVHGATSNLLAGNRVIATGTSSVYIDNSVSAPALNRFYKNRVRFTNAFNSANYPSAIPRQTPLGAIHLTGDQHRAVFYFNDLSEPMFQGSGYVSGVFCERSGPANVLVRNSIRNFSLPYNPPNSPCLALVTGATLLQSTNYESWTADGVRVETNVRHDLHGEQVTTDRIWADVAGGHEVRIPISLNGYQGRTFTLTTLVRRGTNSKIMLRDQISDWYAIFDISGAGSGERGGTDAYQGSTLIRLSDDWYFLAVSFISYQANALLTLRQMNSGPGLFMDLGETRLDVD